MRLVSGVVACAVSRVPVGEMSGTTWRASTSRAPSHTRVPSVRLSWQLRRHWLSTSRKFIEDRKIEIWLHVQYFLNSLDIYLTCYLSSAIQFFLIVGMDAVTTYEDFNKFIVKDQFGQLSCSLCDENDQLMVSRKWSQRKDLRNHVESKHFPNTFTYSCPHCGKIFGTNNAWNTHKARCQNNKVC